MQTVARETIAAASAARTVKPKNKGGRKRAFEAHEEWLDTHEARIAEGCSPKLLNKRLANECNREFQSLRTANPRKYRLISAEQMKRLRKSRRNRDQT